MNHILLLFVLCSTTLGRLQCEELSARIISIYSNLEENSSIFTPGQSVKSLILISGGTTPYRILQHGNEIGSTHKSLIRLNQSDVQKIGAHKLRIQIIDAQAHSVTVDIHYHVGSTSHSPPQQLSNLNLLSDEDDWGEEDEEEDVEDPYLRSEIAVYPWTDNQSRAIMNTMLPSALAIGKNEWYYRILHIARERIDDEPATNFIGLDDNVKIGFQISYGIFENVDVNVQRTNGRTLQVNLSRAEASKMDYYDIIFRYQFLQAKNGDAFDAAIHIGPTLMLRNTGSGEQSINAGLIVEKNFFKDRLRLGAGLAYASLSIYEQTVGKGPATKLTPDEYDALTAAGSPTPPVEDEHTLAIPLMVKYALTKQQQLFAEVIVPIDGYETRAGPSIAAGYRINTNTHEYSVYLSNTGNPSYNGTITGGHDYDEINLFGFFISAYF